MPRQIQFDNELSILEEMILSGSGEKKQYVTRLVPALAWLLIMDCRDRNSLPSRRLEEIVYEYYRHQGKGDRPEDPHCPSPDGTTTSELSTHSRAQS